MEEEENTGRFKVLDLSYLIKSKDLYKESRRIEYYYR